MAIFASLFRDVERRTHPSNPADWLLYALGTGIETTAGKTVDEETAMRLTAVYACVRILAESVSSLPLILYRRVGRGKERATDHPLYALMHDQPHPEMSSMVFRETAMGHLGLWGNSYSYKSKNGAGKIAELWPLRPDKIEVKRIDGDLWYIYQPNEGKPKPFHRRDMLHIPGLSYNGINGLSPIGQAREALGIALGAEETAARLYSQGMRAGGVFEHPSQLSDPARANLKESLKAAIGGSENFHKALILEEGMKWHQLSINPDDAQFIETRKYQLAEIARIYRIPLHFLQELDRATYSNIEQQSLDFVVHTLRPWLVRIEQAYNQQLLSDKDRQQGVFFEHKVDGLLRGDAQSRNNAYAVGVQWGWLSRNDVRELENLNPVDQLDEYLVPLNMITASAAAQGLPAPAQEEENGAPAPVEQRTATQNKIKLVERTRDSFRHLFRDAAQRIVNKEARAIQRLAKKHLSQRSLTDEMFVLFNDIDDFYATLPGYIKDIMGPVCRTYGETFGPQALEFIKSGGTIPAEFKRHLEDYLDVYTKRHIASSMGQLSAIIKNTPPEELYAAIIKRTNEWLERRPDKIAMNEPNRLQNFGSMVLWKGEGVTRHRWVTVGKTCPYCEKVASKDFGMGPGIVGINKPFVDGPVHAQYDIQIKDDDGNVIGTEKKWGTMSSRTIMHPPLHLGCDCMVLPEI